ncbi:hypothetical protein AVEN_269350-1 [Araneus ventricosus]|uniref:DDE-1 domain-containing protein n=1 Tax=Araneus ventricosus TaxID=182803 RepID=A0A4Y2SDA0_ARAVE|nr:hypothetical protein AVEN_269350-1 [Araneus ventricosus]
MGSYQTWCLGINVTLGEYYENYFHIVFCLKMIENAWEGVTKRTLFFAWRKLWSEIVVECDIEESETVLCEVYSQRDRVFGQYQGTGVIVENDPEQILSTVPVALGEIPTAGWQAAVAPFSVDVHKMVLSNWAQNIVRADDELQRCYQL